MHKKAMVIGGGVAGIQAALDLGDMGVQGTVDMWLPLLREYHIQDIRSMMNLAWFHNFHKIVDLRLVQVLLFWVVLGPQLLLVQVLV